MKNIIFILVIAFFISDCHADARVLAEILSKAHSKAKIHVLKNNKPKKKVKVKTRVLKYIKPKEQVIKPKETVTSEELEMRNDLAYMPNEDKPFTGKHEAYHSNKKKYIETNYKDGRKNGLLVMWDENERKIGQLTFMNGNQQEN
ncbi:hypothetical protein [Methylobacter sp.]|uniref:hypothetical protein n=1 Tax=Methylobacter sp. TaxID=2051955 RepID=UPI002FDECE3A